MPTRGGSRRSGRPSNLQDMGEPTWDVLAEIRDSVSGCEIVDSQNGAYCIKHGKHAQPGAARCGSKGAQVDPETYTRMHLEEYVRGVLGIREGRTFRRLVERRSDVSVEEA